MRPSYRYALHKAMLSVCLALLVGICFGKTKAQLPSVAGDALVWGVDFQVVQTRPSLFQVQLTVYESLTDNREAAAVVVHVKERDVEMPPHALNLMAVGVEEMDVVSPVSCANLPQRIRKVVYRADWQKPDYGLWDLYWLGAGPAMPTSNVKAATPLSLWIPLDAIQSTLPGSAFGFAGLPAVMKCPDGLPAHDFVWGDASTCKASLVWEPLFGGEVVKQALEEEGQGSNPPDLASRTMAKPLFQPLEGGIEMKTPTPLCRQAADEWVKLDFLPVTGTFLLSAAAVLESQGQVVGQAKRLWATGL